MTDVLYDKESDEAYRIYLAKGEVRMQRCNECGRFRNPPRFACPQCLSERWAWEPVSGKGVVETFLWYCEPVDRRYVDVPYNVALVRLEEGPGVFANIVDAAMDELAIGQRVVAETGERNGRPVLNFVRAGE